MTISRYLPDEIYRNKVLIASIEMELSLGTKHFNKKHQLQETVEEIVKTLLDEGTITVEPTEERRHLFETKEN